MKRFEKIIAVGSVVAASALIASSAWAQQPGPWGRHMWDGNAPGGFFFGPLMMVAMIAISVAAVILLVRWLSPGGRHAHRRHNTPVAILEERFARGEIDKAEFEERKKVLGA